MGLKTGHQISYTINSVNLTSLYNVAFQLMQEKKIDDVFRANIPTIYIDASWVVRSMTCSPQGRTAYFVRFCCCLSRAGFHVVVVCDGDKRHWSKRSTIKRKADSYYNKIMFMRKKCELQNLRHCIENEKSNIRTAELRVMELNLVSDTRLLYNKIENEVIDVGNKFYESLKIMIEKLTECELGAGEITVQQAIFQADTVLSEAIINNKAEILLTSDTDQLALSGKDCIGIKKYKYNDKGLNSNIHNIDLYFAWEQTHGKCAQLLNLPTNSAKIQYPQRPVFNDLDDYNVRGLIAIVLGCDMTLNNFLSLKVLHDYLVHLQQQQIPLDEYYDKILVYTYNKTSKNGPKNLPFDSNITFDEFKRFLDGLVQAYIYEPANIADDDEFGYPKHLPELPPKELHPYVHDFTYGCKQIKTGLPDVCSDLLLCVGPGDKSHYFFRFEGKNACNTCQKTICKTCTFTAGNNGACTYCVECFASESTVTLDKVESLVPTEIMIKRLRDIGQEVSRSDNHEDIMDLYEYYILEPNNNVYGEDYISSLVKYPLFTPTIINELTFITQIDLNEGGTFIGDNNLNNIQQIQIIELFSELVTIGQPLGNNLSSLEKMYKVLPTMVVHFAEESRIHEAYRLLRRCIRHASDPLFPNIINAEIKLFVTTGNSLGMYIKHKVRASMQQQNYDVEVAYTKSDLLCCKCTCRAGGTDTGRSMCVHVLPLLYKLTQIMFEGLAEHLLVNLASISQKLLGNSNDSIPLVSLQILYKSILKLIDATTYIYNHTIMNGDTIQKCISDALEHFQVGTQKPKYQTRIIDVTKLGPLSNLQISSSLTNAATIIQKSDRKNEDEHKATNISDNDISTWCSLPPETYSQIISCIKVFDKYLQIRNRKSKTNYKIDRVGYKLLELRAHPNFPKLNISKKVINAIALASIDKRIISGETQKNKIDLQRNKLIKKRFAPQNTANQKRKIRYCCVCNKNSDTNPELKLRRIPIVGVQPITKESDDKHRKLMAKSIYKRKQYFKRFNIRKKIETTGLEYCQYHVMNDEKVTIPFVDRRSKKLSFKTILHLPEDIRDRKRKTRSESENIITTTVATLKHGRSKEINSPKYVKKQKRNAICDVYRCNHEECEEGTFLISIPRKPNKLNLLRKGLKNIERKRHACKVEFRKYCCASLGIHPNDKRSNLRFCNHHEIKRKNVTVVWYNNNGQSKTVKCRMNLPSASPIRPQNITKKRNKGIARDRSLIRHADEARKESEQGNKDAEQMLVMNQIAEREKDETDDSSDDESLTGLINETVADLVGIKKTKAKLKLGFEILGNNKNHSDNTILDCNTTYQLNTISDKEVTRCTGFTSLTSLIAFIVILNNGDIDQMLETVTNLTWFEEYFLYFERIWGRTATRWADCENKYKISEKSCRRIFDSKLNLHVQCRKKWPRFAKYMEDTELKKQQWSNDYGERRIIMWDNTDISIPKPSDAEAQRLTYSPYYGGNVAKGSIFIQPCGWMGTGELWMGAVSDSEYMERSGILTYQAEYLQKYDNEYDDKIWNIILDKGYRINATALRCGGQKVIQPSFARSDQKFSSTEMLRSSAIARDRAGNERAVRLVKQSGYLHSGLKQNGNIHRLMDVWLCWGFQCNFMFASVIRTDN
jgi:hypothetical protein